MWMEVGRVPAGIQKFHLKDLHDDHEYLIRIFARNEIGSSEPLESDEPYKVVLTGGKCGFVGSLRSVAGKLNRFAVRSLRARVRR